MERKATAKIGDAKVLMRLQTDWEGVRRLRQRMQDLCVTAFELLRNVLEELAMDGRWACGGDELGRLVRSGKTRLDWLDWQAVRDGVERRNRVAHGLEFFGSDVCMAEITRIENQLVAWNVIIEATKGGA